MPVIFYAHIHILLVGSISTRNIFQVFSIFSRNFGILLQVKTEKYRKYWKKLKKNPEKQSSSRWGPLGEPVENWHARIICMWRSELGGRCSGVERVLSGRAKIWFVHTGTAPYLNPFGAAVQIWRQTNPVPSGLSTNGTAVLKRSSFIKLVLCSKNLLY